jgi:hypothetical protein
MRDCNRFQMQRCLPYWPAFTHAGGGRNNHLPVSKPVVVIDVVPPDLGMHHLCTYAEKARCAARTRLTLADMLATDRELLNQLAIGYSSPCFFRYV